MIKFANNLHYVSDFDDSKKRKKLMKRISRRKPVISAYIITFASNRDNLFDIINANELVQPIYKKKSIFVIGLANDFDSAVTLVSDMVLKVYSETGTFDVRKFYGEG